MTDPVRAPAMPPAQRHGEIYRHVADSSAQNRLATTYLYTGVFELLVMGVLAFFLEPPVRWLLLAFGVAGCAMFTLVLYPRAKRSANYAGDDLIDLIVTPSGPITRGGFQLSWRELSQFRLEVLTNMGGKGKVGMHALLVLADGAAVKARTTTEPQRSVFTGQKIKANLGVPDKAEAERVRDLLERACAQGGVPFDYRERHSS
ncbi:MULTISPECIES: hypothetical protein [Prauserella salsuginis group]|uniref:Uncharacterized protein n=2 Tax=Prauserella salsuginis group TaxID=2893672 RepID=A0A839XK00_9PSEU|nr:MULTISPECIES: hypothetical protein [Prauserella salsuginis group]MBB3662877.1 hypothetical protein [Prauserella sediminis]MCR3720574.1 hypothetical protein [Prauserella flava]MCR3733716.1 hypothetical protein [Prauserella salsuginis]